jgi:hypothetical protein
VARIALATAAFLPDLDEDGPELLAALAAEGLDVTVAVWSDETVDWSAFDLVVVRTTWDYFDHRDAFLAWAASVPRLVNPAAVLEWNTDKAYLRRLAEAGIPTVPTTWLEPGDDFTPPDHPFVVKPRISAGARDTAAYPAGATSHAQSLLDAGRPVMVQPYIAEVDTVGETSVLVFEGEVSHAAGKAAILEVGRPVDNAIDSRSFVTPREPGPAEVAMAQQVVELAQSWGDPLLYARVDLLPGPVLIELEVTEPSLFLRHAPGSAQRFARAVARAAARSGGATPRS